MLSCFGLNDGRMNHFDKKKSLNKIGGKFLPKNWASISKIKILNNKT